jgi:hypothetical protein
MNWRKRRDMPWILAAAGLVVASVFIAGVVLGWPKWPSSVLRAVLGVELCYNQLTGQPMKWYVVQPGGQIALYDSPGFDASGRAKRPVTQQFCRGIEAQKRGVKPKPIADDVRHVKFFDEMSGLPRVWYYKSASGEFELFDAEGIHPTMGEALFPVTREVADEVRALAIARAAEAERALQAKIAAEAAKKAEEERLAALEQERLLQIEIAAEAAKKAEEQRLAALEQERLLQIEIAAEAAKKAEEQRLAALEQERLRKEEILRAHANLVRSFGAETYDNGVVLVGAAPRKHGEMSDRASKVFLRIVTNAFARKGLNVDEYRPQVYSLGHYEALAGGDVAALAEVGLAQKMRSTLLTLVDANCRPSAAGAGIVSCTIFVQSRAVNSAGVQPVRRLTKTGVGANEAAALLRAAELMVENYP